MAWNTIVILSCVLVYVHAHGRLVNPPTRGSLWRFGYQSPANYDDDGLNCGGFYHQHSVNGGKCGICGDAYDHRQPRAHELGGTYGLGYIVANYEAGQIIYINIYLSASHLGFWELRICPDPNYQEQECFDNGYLLELEEGGTKFYPTRGDGTYESNFRLPADLTCDHCVLQWQYTAGNNWGVCTNGTQGLGCGNQEQFYSCSDISIQGGTSKEVTETATTETTTTESKTTETTTTETTTTETTTTETTVTPVVTEAPPVVSTPLIDGLVHDFVNLNPLELNLLLRGIDLSNYRIFYGNTPVTSNKPKKHGKGHRRKKNKKRKSKRHKRIFYWR